MRLKISAEIVEDLADVASAALHQDRVREVDDRLECSGGLFLIGLRAVGDWEDADTALVECLLELIKGRLAGILLTIGEQDDRLDP